MASGVSIQVSGLDELRKKLGQIPENVKILVDAELKATADNFINRAVIDAPVDESSLRRGLSVKKVGDMSYEAVSAAYQSAFIEFGTKSRAQVPATLQAYAAQFKGQKGKGKFFENILKWVKRKGLAGTFSVKTHRRTGNKKTKDQQDKQAAFAIARSIAKHGIHPHPFFFKQMPLAEQELKQALAQIVKNAMK